MRSKRIFVAIKIANTNQIREIFRQVGLDLSKEKIKWVKEQGLHITLFFIGNKLVDEIPVLIQSLRKISEGFCNFKLNLQGMGTFPSFDRPRILWIGIKKNPVLFDLQKEIQENLKNNSNETVKYTPHLTIGRIKGGVQNSKMVEYSLGKWKEWEGDEILVKDFVLMESVLNEKGPEYKVLEIFQLKG